MQSLNILPNFTKLTAFHIIPLQRECVDLFIDNNFIIPSINISLSFFQACLKSIEKINVLTSPIFARHGHGHHRSAFHTPHQQMPQESRTRNIFNGPDEGNIRSVDVV